MNEEYSYSIKVGDTRRKVEPLYMVVGKPYCNGEANDWISECSMSGFYSESKKVEGRSAFDALMCGTAYLRQTLRLVQQDHPKLKLYFEFDGDLDELMIDDIFMTHDCITDDMEEMIEWAKSNGFEPE